MASLILKRASSSRPSGEWSDDDYDVFADGAAVGRIMKAHRRAGRLALVLDARLRLSPGYAATREAAMAAFKNSWERR
jgi:hypothetical protein